MLLYFGLDCGMLEFFTHEQESKEQLMSLPHFWSTVWRKRSWFEHIQTVIQTSRRFDSFLHEAAQNFELLSNTVFKIKNKNKKNLVVDVLFKAYPMVPLSCRSNRAGRYLLRFLSISQGGVNKERCTPVYLGPMSEIKKSS